MATIDSKKLIDELIKNNGHYSDDPPVVFIGEYKNFAGNKTWFILYENESWRLSEYLILPEARLIWEREN